MESIKVKIKKLNDKAVIPSQAREGDFCYDVVAISEEEVAPNVWRYGLGLAYEIKRTDFYIAYIPVDIALRQGVVLDLDILKLSIDFRPRSSVWKTGMILSNCVGTLDEFYRGEMMAVYYHIFPNMPRYKVGDKIGQIKLGITLPIKFEEVEEINMNTERGTGGFGSTDKKE